MRNFAEQVPRFSQDRVFRPREHCYTPGWGEILDRRGVCLRLKASSVIPEKLRQTLSPTLPRRVYTSARESLLSARTLIPDGIGKAGARKLRES